MKIVAFIMAFLVLALSVMSCTDAGNAVIDVKAKKAVVKSSQPGDSLGLDNCSPFCQCSCCAGFSVNHFIASVTHLQPYLNKATSSHLRAKVIEIALPVWQPPQLV